MFIHEKFVLLSHDITGKVNLEESGKIKKDEFAALTQNLNGKPKQTSFIKNHVFEVCLKK